MLHEETIAFSWDAQEFEYREKSKKWYYILGGIALLGIVGAILLQNYLFAFVILVSAFLMIIQASKQPEDLTIEISNQGISLNNKHYTYEMIDGFWISRGVLGEPTLLFHLHRNVDPIESIVIDDRIDPMELRDYLLDFAEEEEIKEPLANRIIRRIGF